MGFFNRNLDKEILDENSDEFNDKDEIVNKLELVANKILKLKLKKNSYWYNKANMFSIIVAFYNNYDKVLAMDNKTIKNKFEQFESQLPEDYRIAAKEGVIIKRKDL